MIEDHIEKEPLDRQVSRAEHEGRMVLPGIQALFGFQLIAIFNLAFQQMSLLDRKLHLIALICTALSAMLIMTPAAYHRQNERGIVSKKFVILSSQLIRFSMVFLAASVCIDVDIIARMVLGDIPVSHIVTAALLGCYLISWFVWPLMSKSH